MKNKFKTGILFALFVTLLTSCSKDTDLPSLRVPFFKEDFQQVTNNTNLDITGWTNFAESGTWLWREKTFYDSATKTTNGYAEFSAFNSNAAVNKVWLVSPAINMDQYENDKLLFSVAQHHLDVDSPGNSLEVFISTDYDGTNVLAATWKPIPANIPKKADAWYKFFKTTVDLSSYKGDIYVAFKFTGSGTDTTLDGAFQIDNFYVYDDK